MNIVNINIIPKGKLDSSNIIWGVDDFEIDWWSYKYWSINLTFRGNIYWSKVGQIYFSPYSQSNLFNTSTFIQSIKL